MLDRIKLSSEDNLEEMTRVSYDSTRVLIRFLDSHGNIIRYLGQLVGGQVQLHHVDPGPDVCNYRIVKIKLQIIRLGVVHSPIGSDVS